MKNQIIDWSRVSRAIHQKDKSVDLNRITDFVIPLLEKISEKMGEYGTQRVNLTLLGEHILKEEFSLKVLVPVCPDYSHKNDLYTMKSLGSGISLVAQKHIAFLTAINNTIIPVKATFLFADYEIFDSDLMNSLSISKDEFLKSINTSNKICGEIVSLFGWDSFLMSEFIPDLMNDEKKSRTSIKENTNFLRQIDYDTLKRDVLYSKINRAFTSQQKKDRTIRTAAQYHALGLFATKNNYIVCNHTTTNLVWYARSSTPLLHNPVVIY